MLTPAQFERQMKIYKDQLDDIFARYPEETPKSWEQKADIFSKIHKDMCDILTQWGYKASIDIINEMYRKIREDEGK